jgi:hypothetical protein
MEAPASPESIISDIRKTRKILTVTHLAGLFPAYSENKPIKNRDYGMKPY